MRRLVWLSLLVLAAGCKEPERIVDSARAKEDIAIDGDASEWIDDLRFNEEANLAYAIRNDDHYLYLCIKSDRRIFQQVMQTGLTVWFDSTAKGQKILGIRYPIGRQISDHSAMPEFEPGAGGRPDMEKHRANMLGELEILGPEKEDRNRAPAQNVFGIQAAIGGFPDDPVYELKIPLMLAEGQPYAIAAPPGSTISLGFVSDKSKRPAHPGRGGMGGGMRPGGGGEGPGGMGPGGRGPGGGAPGGMGRGDGPPRDISGGPSSESDPIKIWLRVRLAKE